ncbi:hypothetical protein [Microbulbifer aggregans]|uniref:hypothetical protein n=1 Tax=Microbulbifer aggregans TaxID=1769779 RepID=UPI001CFD3059|nr:hypothetical protein [Microbulbifer aggregans]
MSLIIAPGFVGGEILTRIKSLAVFSLSGGYVGWPDYHLARTRTAMTSFNETVSPVSKIPCYGFLKTRMFINNICHQ